MDMSMWRNAMEIYEYLCRPVCQAANIQQGELNVLLFLGNNPGKNTAVDIHKCGGMKQSMVSVLVEKLVQGGYLERQGVPGDRRKIRLVCTEKAEPVIEAAREVQQRMIRCATEGIAREDKEAVRRVTAAVVENIMRCRELMLSGELK